MESPLLQQPKRLLKGLLLEGVVFRQGASAFQGANAEAQFFWLSGLTQHKESLLQPIDSSGIVAVVKGRHARF